jgi:hypothetical protein
MFLMAQQPERLMAGRPAAAASARAAAMMMIITTPSSEAGRTRAS